MTKILVTGANGFIGRHLIPELHAADHEVDQHGSDSGDVAADSTWNSFAPCEVVLHLAGKSFVPASWSDPLSFFKFNTLGTICALNYCVRHKARLVLLSSYLYGRPEHLPIPENAPLSANNPYAFSKKMAEEAARFYADHFGVNTTVLRLFNVYGPGQNSKFLIPFILEQLRNGSAIRVKDLEPRRDYVYISDVVLAIVKAIEPRLGFNAFNIGAGVSHSVTEVIAIIQEIWGTDLPVHGEAERRDNEIMDTVADISSAKRELEWTPKFTLRDGMMDMYARARAKEMTA